MGCVHVLESVKELTLHDEDWVYESEPRQTYVLKTGKDSSTAKRSSEGINYTGPWRCQYKWMPRDTVGVTRYKNPHCSIAMGECQNIQSFIDNDDSPYDNRLVLNHAVGYIQISDVNILKWIMFTAYNSRPCCVWDEK